MSISADRLLAARLLLRIDGGSFASRLLAGPVPAGVRARVLGVLRWQRALDAVLARPSRQPLERLDAEVRTTLRIGLFDAVLLGVPAPVATDGAVHLVRRLGCGSAAGLINAVLRRAVGEWTRVIPTAPPDLRFSHPGWLHARWLAQLGADAAEDAMASAQEPAAVWAWFVNRAARDELEESGVGLVAHPWCPGAWRTEADSRSLVRQVERGRAYAQDPSSQLVAHVGHRLAGGRGSVVDPCAAPGGKSALLALLGGWSTVVAGDLKPFRASMAGRLLDRVGGGLVVAADATNPPFIGESWDFVLLDAPCSGTGTLRRHPELKWRLRREGINEMAALQDRLLAASLGLVARGGTLLYATCSIEAEENEALFESTRPGFERTDLEAALPEGVPWVPTAAGGIRIPPNADGDGFTMHALKRVIK